MSKAVLISIRPKWCEKIASGEKTIEVRKTRPKLETPFKCYIYCTQPKYPHEDFIVTEYPKPQFYGGGKVIGEFLCSYIIEFPVGASIDPVSAMATCLPMRAIHDYFGTKTGYGWCISHLRIYDKPRELSEFERPYECDGCDARWASECNACHDNGKLKRPPQSWGYVEELP